MNLKIKNQKLILFTFSAMLGVTLLSEADPRAPNPELQILDRVNTEGQIQKDAVFKFDSLLRITYQIKQSQDLFNWTNLGPEIRGTNSSKEVVDSSLTSESKFYRIAWNAPAAPSLPPVQTFCAIGDSITDRATYNYPSGYQGLAYDQSGWAAILEQYSNRRIQSVARSNAFKTDRDHGYSGITTWMYLDGGGWLPNGLIPINDAIASNPDFFIVHIGTNDIAADSASAITNRIHLIWERLVATGKPVIGTDILHRPAAYPGWSAAFRDRVNQVNANLRASWQAKGLVSYRPWDDLIEKDLNGFAMNHEFPNDYVHPTMRVGLQLGKDLHNILSPFYSGTTHPIPTFGDSAWLTPNPQVTGSGGLAPSWSSYAMGNVGTDVVYSKTTDTEGTWQKVQIINPQSYGTKGVYSRSVSSGGNWQVGDPCIATARIRVPKGTQISGVGISVQCAGANPAWIEPATIVNTATPSPIDDYDTTIVTDPFTIPANTSQLWFLIRVAGGTGSFEFRSAGVFKAPL